ncbi:hypothetical protein BS47DRAFT_1346773 [Hydnum rufescens UP504]|uniref:Uncharacterized protein n=1 Tax=Hydnum rufescens UP504 TaxID=1448309 RepID=A0A9P6ASX4_9AGAM|nr:hypothetical protein BS47DRAFT_1346773 [Hydnum rufescens UP504]
MSDARSILLMVSEVFGPSGILRYASERTLGQITAVALFIIRMINDSHITPYLEGDQTDYILFLKDFACALHDAAIDERHNLAIYSQFVREQLCSPSQSFQNDTELPVFLLERAFRPLA